MVAYGCKSIADVAHEDHTAGILAVAGALPPASSPAGRATTPSSIVARDLPSCRPVQTLGAGCVCSPRPVAGRLPPAIRQATEVVGIRKPLKRFVRECDDPARQGVGNPRCRRYGSSTSVTTPGRGPRRPPSATCFALPGTPGSTAAVFPCSASRPVGPHPARVCEHRLEHRSKAGQVLHPVHLTTSARLPVEACRAASLASHYAARRRLPLGRCGPTTHHRECRPVDQGHGEGGQVDVHEEEARRSM